MRRQHMAEHSSKTMAIVAAVKALYGGNTFAPTDAELAEAVGRIVDEPTPAQPPPSPEPLDEDDMHGVGPR
jgi:hypothetical protein